MTTCQQEQIVAYIDGELDASSLDVFEQHLEACESCRAELTDHRLLLCELDAVMGQPPDVSAPANFAQIIAAHAETDMQGVRSRAEHKRALRLILIVGLAAFSLLGTSAADLVTGSGRVLATDIFGLAGFLWSVIYDTGVSAAVISKVLSRKLFIESGSLGWSVVFLGLAVLLLSRLIVSYHRTRAIE
ncbi:MAG TPA: zf-HC2 domain-containing protein [Pyrinomonadaceae bacterium]|nr:zf-HC2 domain-containing protein [Pyrinomonadaceae bacterium]